MRATPTAANRTIVSMIYADGAGSATFAIYHARVRYRGTAWSANVNHPTTRQVGIVRQLAGSERMTYQAMANLFASTDYPAVDYKGL